MPHKISITLPDELAERLTILADHYEAPVMDLILEIITSGAAVCEDAIHCEACQQIAWLAHVDPAGRA